jgi:hypothetical protein
MAPPRSALLAVTLEWYSNSAALNDLMSPPPRLPALPLVRLTPPMATAASYVGAVILKIRELPLPAIVSLVAPGPEIVIA